MHVPDAAAKTFSSESLSRAWIGGWVLVRTKKTRQTMMPHAAILAASLGEGNKHRRQASDVALHRKNSVLADEAHDVLCRLQGLFGDQARALGPVDQDLIDMAGVGHQP